MKTYITLTALGNCIDIKELAVGEELILEESSLAEVCYWWWLWWVIYISQKAKSEPSISTIM